MSRFLFWSQGTGSTPIATDALSDLKEYLRVRNDAEDALILRLYDAAIARIEADTGEYYGPAKTITEVLDGYGLTIWLLAEPTSITSVESYEGGLWNPITAYESSGRRITLTEDVAAWPTQRRVIYDTGMDYADIPEDVKQRIFQLVTLWFEQRLPQSGQTDVEQSVIGAVGGI